MHVLTKLNFCLELVIVYYAVAELSYHNLNLIHTAIQVYNVSLLRTYPLTEKLTVGH